jgi:hypothetical protein
MSCQHNSGNIYNTNISNKTFENVAMFKCLELQYQTEIALKKKLRPHKFEQCLVPGVDKYRSPGRHGAWILMVFLARICKKKKKNLAPEKKGLAPELLVFLVLSTPAWYCSVQNLLSPRPSKNLNIQLHKTIMFSVPLILYRCESWSLTPTEARVWEQGLEDSSET